VIVVQHLGTPLWSLLQESNIQLSTGILSIEGKTKGGTEVTGRRGRGRRKLLDDRKERRGYSHLKEEDLDRTMWRARFGRGFGPVVRQTTK
jgi:hypothetical protein